ncbi:hypothetical protein OSB04_un000782 [Centaurea solstitialis]|uniref:Fe2OG dioxygenase domain-containing protein n=1 Tax=Centaurea solstitialis TaxID=347529 RepID=A0AA38SHC3_9ASTR|nr:hypothetical protein OSB04_un000782 [Centaurea solstitialis]
MRRTSLGRLPVRGELDRRGVDLNSILCPWCECEEESVVHAFFGSVKDASLHCSKEWRNGIPSFQPHTHFAKLMSSYPARDMLHKRKKFSLILPRDTKSILGVQKEVGTEAKSRYKILGPGMLLLKGHLSISEQVEVVKKCEKLGVGPGGFYEPYPGAAKLRRLLMCLGRNWQPETQYKERFRRNDGSEAPPIPDEFVRMVENILQASRSVIKSEYELPFMTPDVCLLNFYTDVGNLALHQDRSESPYSLRVGLPVISISFGDSGVFLYGFDRNIDKASSILLESGDVLVFGGKSRLIYHGVKSIIPNSAPLALLQQTMLRPGRLNLTFREY